jgi:hypothetical protein
MAAIDPTPETPDFDAAFAKIVKDHCATKENAARSKVESKVRSWVADQCYEGTCPGSACLLLCLPACLGLGRQVGCLRPPLEVRPLAS